MNSDAQALVDKEHQVIMHAETFGSEKVCQ